MNPGSQLDSNSRPIVLKYRVLPLELSLLYHYYTIFTFISRDDDVYQSVSDLVRENDYYDMESKFWIQASDKSPTPIGRSASDDPSKL